MTHVTKASGGRAPQPPGGARPVSPRTPARSRARALNPLQT